MTEPWAKAIATVAVCVAGGVSMCTTNGATGIGWTILGVLLIWGAP